MSFSKTKGGDKGGSEGDVKDVVKGWSCTPKKMPIFSSRILAMATTFMVVQSMAVLTQTCGR